MLKRTLNLILVFIFMFTASLKGEAKWNKPPTLTERARKAWIKEHISPDSSELALIKRLKWLRILRVTKNYSEALHGESAYDRVRDLDLKTQQGQRIFDSLLDEFLTEIDLRYNPDTPENEFTDEMMRRMKYCDDNKFLDWWNSSDLRADIVIQEGLDWLIYVPPYEVICTQIPRRLKSNTCCFHCQISYTNKGIFFQLEGKTSECLDKIVVWEDNDCLGLFPPSDDEKLDKLLKTQDIFRKEIAKRETPPAYKPFKSGKNLKMALRIIRRPLEDGTCEVWSLLAAPFGQFARDSLNRVNFDIYQLIWSMENVPEMCGRDSLGGISAEVNDRDKDGFYFSAIRSILPPGKWKFVLTPIEYSEDTNKTIFSTDIEIPDKPNAGDLSDIMLYLDMDNGKVEIDGKHYVGLPFSSFKNEHTLNAMVSDCNMPQRGTSLIAWYLRPLKNDEYVTRGRPKVEEDSTKWISWPEGSVAFDTVLFPVRKFLEKDDIVLVCREVPNRRVFELNQPLVDVPHGDYELRFLIMEPRLKDNRVRESMTVITIK